MKIFPQYAFQTGATPEFKEKARDHSQKYNQYSKENMPVSPKNPIYDSKWRYFWMVGERDKELDKDMIIYPNVSPPGFPEFKNTMDSWGNKMLNGCETAARMAALGFGLDENILVEKMKYGGHLLAPTGSDLAKFDPNTIFAGFHYDLNFLTIHGKSNYGGLFIWLRNGSKKKVKVPDGCLLLQAGIQFEYLTGGEVLCGFHEVVYTHDVYEQIQKIKEENKGKNESDRKILWRISSTLFSQIRQNVVLEPLEKFRNPSSIKKYPKILIMMQRLFVLINY